MAILSRAAQTLLFLEIVIFGKRRGELFGLCGRMIARDGEHGFKTDARAAVVAVRKDGSFRRKSDQMRHPVLIVDDPVDAGIGHAFAGGVFSFDVNLRHRKLRLARVGI